MNDLLISIFQILNNYSFLHSSTYLLLFFTFLFNYFLIFLIYSLTTKNIHRFILYCFFAPLLIILKIIFGTTLFTTFPLSILDFFCLSLSFLLIFLLESAYLHVSSNAYHECKHQQSHSNKMLDAYILIAILFFLNFLSFYPISL